MKAIRTIGFTGTIASGKTSRCKHLVEVAQQRRATLAHPTPAAATVASSSSSAAAAMAVASTRTPSDAATPVSVAVHYINADLVGHGIYEPGKPCYFEVLQHFGSSILSKSTGEAAAVPSPSQLGESLGRRTPTAGTAAALPMIDRRVLGEIVFSEEHKLQELNAICWPYISAAIKAEYATVCTRLRGGAPLPTLSTSPATTPARATAGSCVPPGVGSPTAGFSPATTSTSGCPSAATPCVDVGLIIIEAALLCEMTEVLGLTTDVWMTHCTTVTAVDRVMVRNHLSREAAEKRVASQLNVEAKLRHLRHLPYHGDVEVFDTTQVSLAQGLRETEAAFDRYWNKKIAVHLSQDGRGQA